jgi:hypothetical protein
MMGLWFRILVLCGRLTAKVEAILHPVTPEWVLGTIKSPAYIVPPTYLDC